MEIVRLDHLVLTVADVEATVGFYEKLGMRREAFGGERVALRFGDQKINLHQQGAEIHPNAAHATPGSADLCLLVFDPIEHVIATLGRAGIGIEEGPVERTGATSAITSVYVRDPDGNLVELARSR